MSMMRTVFRTAAMGAAMMVVVPAVAVAQSSPLTPQQQQVVGLAQSFNQCLADRENDPSYRAQKRAYESEAFAAQRAYDREVADYQNRMRDYRKVFDEFAERDGTAKTLDALNQTYATISKMNNWALESVLETQMTALRAQVKNKITAATGLEEPEFPAMLSQRITIEKPEDPTIYCAEQFSRDLASRHVNEMAFDKIINDVLKAQGPDIFNLLTAAKPRP